MYAITVNAKYSPTSEDLYYLRDNNMEFVGSQIRFKATEKYQLERAKSALRRLPNDSFYNSLMDDLALVSKIRPNIKAK